MYQNSRNAHTPQFVLTLLHVLLVRLQSQNTAQLLMCLAYRDDNCTIIKVERSSRRRFIRVREQQRLLKLTLIVLAFFVQLTFKPLQKAACGLKSSKAFLCASDPYRSKIGLLNIPHFLKLLLLMQNDLVIILDHNL